MFLGTLEFGMAVRMHPIAYHEPWGGFAPLAPTICNWRRFTLFAKKSMDVGVVIAGVGGIATSGYATWEPHEGRQLDSPNPLVLSGPR